MFISAATKSKRLALSPGDKRAERRHRPGDVLNPDALPDLGRNLRADAFGVAVRIHEAVGDFVCAGAAHEALALDVVEAGGRGGRRAEAERQDDPGQAVRNSFAHAYDPSRLR